MRGSPSGVCLDRIVFPAPRTAVETPYTRTITPLCDKNNFCSLIEISTDVFEGSIVLGACSWENCGAGCFVSMASGLMRGLTQPAAIYTIQQNSALAAAKASLRSL